MAPFATVETSPGCYHAYIEFKLKDREELTPIEWNAFNSYLIQQYGGDKGANAAGHAFRLPIGSSHKYDPPIELKLQVFEDAEPAVDADVLLQQISPQILRKLKGSLIGDMRFTRRLRRSRLVSDELEETQEDLIRSGRAPVRQNGTVDDSAVDFIVSRDILSAYKDKRSERLTPMLNFCHCMLCSEAELRQKARPEDYAIRTINAVIDRVQLPIKKKSESELEI